MKFRAIELLAFVCLTVVVVGCQAKGGKQEPGKSGSSNNSHIAINLPSSSSSVSSFFATAQPVNFFVPNSLSDFDCFAVNVIAGDIKTAPACGGQTQMGLAAGFVGRGGNLELDVPFGKGRIFQIWGFGRSSNCPDVIKMLITPNGGIPEGLRSTGFLLGQKQTDVFSRNMTVDIPVSFTFGTNPIICGSVPPPATSIDSVKLQPTATAIANQDTTSSLVPVCINFTTTATSPSFTVYQDNVATTLAQGTCPAGAPNEYVHRFDPVTTGTHTFRVETTDTTYGQVDPSPPTFTWAIDTTPPVLSISKVLPGKFSGATLNNYTTSLNPIALLSISEAGSIRVGWEQTSPVGPSAGPTFCAATSSAGSFTCAVNPSLNAVDAEFRLTFTAIDKVGNSAVAISTDVVFDSTPPVISLSPNDGWIMGGDFSSAGSPNAAVITVTDTGGELDTSALTCSVDSSTPASCTSGTKVTFPSGSQYGGKHTLAVTAKDFAGNTTTFSQVVYMDSLLGQTVVGKLNSEGGSLTDESSVAIDTSTSQPMAGAIGMKFTSQSALDVHSGYLYVADQGNNRVLVFKWNNLLRQVVSHKAVAVFGQYDFTDASTGHLTATIQGQSFTRMNTPTGLDISTDQPKKLFVSDTYNHRILRFDVSTAPFGNGLDVSTARINRVAEAIFGQADATSNALNRNGLDSNSGGSISNGLSSPNGLAFSRTLNRLYVADRMNCRVAYWDTATSAATGATLGGQLGVDSLDFTGAWACPIGVASNIRLSNPRSVSLDGTKLYVADAGFNRILRWDSIDVATFATAASGVYGQPDFTTSTAADGEVGDLTTVSTMGNPTGVSLVLDAASNKYVAATSTGSGGTKHRVMFYQQSGGLLSKIWNTSGITADGSLYRGPNVFNQPWLPSYENNSRTLLVPENGSHRLGIFSTSAISDDQSMTDVLGHSDLSGTFRSFTSIAENGPNEATLFQPTYAVADTSYLRLYVADTGNNRIMVYNIDPVTYRPGKTAVATIGVRNFTNGTPLLDSTRTTFGTLQNTLTRPTGLALDGLQRLWVSDTSNNRVLRFPTNTTTLTAGMNADLVLGQTGFGSSSSGSTSTELNAPAGLAFDTTSSFLFVADQNNHRVQVFDLSTSPPNGVAAAKTIGTGVAGATTTQLDQPLGLSFSSGTSVISKGIFVTEHNNHRVSFFPTTGAIATWGTATACYGHRDAGSSIAVACAAFGQNAGQGATVSTRGDYSMNAPYGAFFDSAVNKLYVADTSNSRVTVFDISTAVNQPGLPDVASGNVAYHVVGSYNLTLPAFGGSTATPAALKRPVGIIHLTPGTGTNLLYIVDRFWHRVGVYEVP